MGIRPNNWVVNMPYKNREERLAYHRNYNPTYHKLNQDKDNARTNLNRKFYRKMLFDILGHECVKCGFKDKRALQFDHIEGKGRKDHYKYGGGMVRYYAKRPLTAIKTLQVLCANCNYIKRIENNETKRNVG